MSNFCPNAKLAEIAVWAVDRTRDAYVVRKYVACAVGIYVGTTCDLARDDTDQFNAELAYDRSAQGWVMNKISSINETLVHDTDMSIRIAKAVWLSRFNYAYPSKKRLMSVYQSADFPIIDCMTGFSINVTDDENRFMNANAQVILTLVNRLTLAC